MIPMMASHYYYDETPFLFPLNAEDTLTDGCRCPRSPTTMFFIDIIKIYELKNILDAQMSKIPFK